MTINIQVRIRFSGIIRWCLY